MSEEIKTGGPAFPTENELQVGTNAYLYEGMTLRDYFAAKAMQGFCTQEGYSRMGEIANDSYELADAMLKERESIK